MSLHSTSDFRLLQEDLKLYKERAVKREINPQQRCKRNQTGTVNKAESCVIFKAGKDLVSRGMRLGQGLAGSCGAELCCSSPRLCSRDHLKNKALV